MEKNLVYETILSRRSIRNYKDKPVDKETITLLLKAAMAAPSACNLQPWEFIIINECETLQKIEELGNNYNAPLMIVVCGSNRNVPWGGEGWKLDCGAAIENMMIAGRAFGLGSLWVGGADSEKLKKILEIPDEIEPVGIIYFGYSDEECKYGSHYKEDAVFWGKYDKSRIRILRSMEMLDTDMYDIVE